MLIQENLEAEIETGKIYFCRIHFGPSEMRKRHSGQVASQLVLSGFASMTFEFQGGTARNFDGAMEFKARLSSSQAGPPVVCIIHDFQELSAAGILAFEDVFRSAAIAGRAFYVLNASALEAVPERILACSAWMKIS